MILHPFLSVAMKTKSSNLFNQTGGLVTVLYPTLCLYALKTTSNHYYLKVKKCQGKSVENESARAKKKRRPGGAPTNLFIYRD